MDMFTGALNAVAEAVKEATGIAETQVQIAARHVCEIMKEHKLPADKLGWWTAGETKDGKTEPDKINLVIDDSGIDPERYEWVLSVGLNSLSCDETWLFLADKPENKRYRDLFLAESKFKKIKIVFDDSNTDPAVPAVAQLVTPTASEGEAEQPAYLEIAFGKTATNIPHEGCGPSAKWQEEPQKKKDAEGKETNEYEEDNRWYWDLREEIVSAIDSKYWQTEGVCFYKSGHLGDFKDEDTTIESKDRWFEFRHWVIFWYNKQAEPWECYNFPGKLTQTPVAKDSSDLNRTAVLWLDHNGDMDVSAIRLPNLKLELAKDAPQNGDASAPAADASASAAASAPARKRPAHTEAAHGAIELVGLTVKVEGAKIEFGNATVHDFWEEADGTIVSVKRSAPATFALVAENAKQAESWKVSLLESGVKEAGAGGCCTVS